MFKTFLHNNLIRCRWEESNLQPELYEGSALTVELHRQSLIICNYYNAKWYKMKEKRQLSAVLLIVQIAKQLNLNDSGVLVANIIERTVLC